MTQHRLWCVLLVCFLLSIIAACSHYPYVAPETSAQVAGNDGDTGLKLFDYDRAEIPIRMKFVEETERYSMYLVKFEAHDFPDLKSTQAKSYYFVQKDQRKKSPCLIVFPPTGGGMELVEAFAKFFAERGYTTIGFYRREMFFNPDQDIEYNKHVFQQTVIDVRRAIDFLQTQPGVDPNRVGIMGASLGGIISALATQADSRIKATVMMIAAGDLPTILDRSNYSRVYRFRQSLIKRYGLERDQVCQFGRDKLTEIDPLTYASRIDPKRVLMINGSMDTIIPLAAARTTWEAFGKPEWRILPVTHYSSMLLVEYAQHLSWSHFKRVMPRP